MSKLNETALAAMVDAVNGVIKTHELRVGQTLGLLGACLISGAYRAELPADVLIEALTAQVRAFYAAVGDAAPNAPGGSA